MDFKRFLIASAAIIAPLTPVATFAQTRTQVPELVIEVFKTITPYPNKVSAQAHIQNDLYISKNNIALLSGLLEASFNVSIPYDAADDMVKVDDWIKYVQQNAPLTPKDKTQVPGIVTRLVASVAGTQEFLITPQTQFVNDYGIVYASADKLKSLIELDFGISIPKSDFDNFVTVGDITTYVQNHAFH